MKEATVLVTIAVRIEVNTEREIQSLGTPTLDSIQNAVVRAVNLNMDDEDFDFVGTTGVYPLRVEGKHSHLAVQS